MTRSGIYIITNPKGRIYIGLSSDILQRWEDYRHLCNFKQQRLLFNSIKKYGYDNHTFEILEEGVEQKNLSEREIFWIAFKKSYYYDNKKLGMNLTRGGNFPNKQTKPKSEAHKRKISEANKGKRHTEETKAKIREARSKQIFTKEQIEKAANSRRGKPSKLKGRKRPNISQKLKGRTTSISIKCKLINVLTNEVTTCDSMLQLSRVTGISNSSLIKMRKGQILKKYKNFRYEQ